LETCFNKLNDISSSTKDFSFSANSNSGKSLCISSIIENIKHKSSIVVLPTDREALSTYKELMFFSKEQSKNIYYLPDSETLPYDSESPHIGLTSERSIIFHKLMSSKKNVILILSANNLLTRISGKSHWISNSITLKVGTVLDEGIDGLHEKLDQLGYSLKDIEVDEIGEYSFRNNVLDLYSLAVEYPVRIKFDSNKILSISKLNLNNQLSEDPIKSLLVLPAKEMPIDKKSTIIFRKKFREIFNTSVGNSIYDSVSSGIFPSGIESYLSMFQKSTTTILDVFLDKEDQPSCFFVGDIQDKINKIDSEVQKRYTSLIEMENRKVLEPENIWLTKEEVFSKLSSFKRIDAFDIGMDSDITVKIKKTTIERKETLQATLDSLDEWVDIVDKIVFCLHSDVRNEQVKTIFDMLDCDSSNVKTWNDAIKDETKVSIINTSVDEGFYFQDTNMLMITEKEVFGQPIFAKKDNEIDKINNFQAVQDLVNLNIGDPIVHLKYGVGRFNGLEIAMVNDIEKEFMTILYAESAKIFVKMDELELISRYAGTDYEKAPLDNISIDGKWMRSTKAAKENVIALAKSLLEIQASRKVQKGKKFKDKDYRYLKFCQEFPFQETRDQKSAVQDILDDLEKEKIMDRVVCGDVGFGKTEVAMQTSFFVANSGYQVAILAPTTLLAQQHYENFKQRFSSFQDIKIRGLFGDNKANERKVLAEIESGEAQIIIGTHKLIQPSVKYKNLGIAIIDEEHRFGVKQKEFFRNARKDINLLSMTATPIPRTLSMSMHGIRDISIISTPPAKRLAIRTFLEMEEISILTEAINREKRRGGQIFYLHNRTETIKAKTEQLQTLFPDLKVKYGHGKMKDAELEALMGEFYRGEFDILVATTIIETGIDIPNANTILIEDAQNFGIAQLHQLRGRVGRSHHQAYCYLLKGEDIVSESAGKRLIAMTKATKLGEGFILANHDLEIRGAGEILGEEQSGQIQKVGFALYLRLLERAITALNNGKDLESAMDLSQETQVDISMSAYIESSFIVNTRARLSFYKRIVSAQSIDEINNIQKEIVDKYGKITVLSERFININKEKITAQIADIKRLMVSLEGVFVSIFEAKESNIMENMLDLVVSDTEKYTIKSPTSFQVKDNLESESERFEIIHDLVKKLSKGIAA
jgi:transcription-repair coupling factor (superfamily II helicase)